MNTHDSEPDSPPPLDEETSSEKNSSGDFTKTVEDAFKSGAEDAKKAFEKAIPKAKEDLAKGVHDIAYAVSYAASFGGALLKELTPESIIDGVREGSQAGRRAAEEVVRDRREKAEREARSHDSEAPGDSEPVFV